MSKETFFILLGLMCGCFFVGRASVKQEIKKEIEIKTVTQDRVITVSKPDGTKIVTVEKIIEAAKTEKKETVSVADDKRYIVSAVAILENGLPKFGAGIMVKLPVFPIFAGINIIPQADTKFMAQIGVNF